MYEQHIGYFKRVLLYQCAAWNSYCATL